MATIRIKRAPRGYGRKAYDQDNYERRSFYWSAAWRALREHKLIISPMCEECKRNGQDKFATDVDHVIRRTIDPSKELDLCNLQSLCKQCHSRKTARETKT